MAETTTHLAAKDITSIKFKDGAGTPKTYTVKPMWGTVSLIQGEYEHDIAKDARGVPLSGASPREAGVRAMCGIRFNCKVFHIGDDATASEYTLPDVVDNDGQVAADWTSTTTAVDATMYTWDVEILVANRTTSEGTQKGATILVPDVRIVGNAQIDVTPDAGFQMDVEYRSVTTVKYTKTATA
jgi:hypothetical protein